MAGCVFRSSEKVAGSELCGSTSHGWGHFSCPRKAPSPRVGNPVGSRSSEPRQAEAGGPPAPPAHQLGTEMPSPGSGRQRTREMTTERHTPAPGHSSPQTSPPRRGCAVTQLPAAPTHLRVLAHGQLHLAGHRDLDTNALAAASRQMQTLAPAHRPEVPTVLSQTTSSRSLCLSLASRGSLAGLRVKLSAPKELQVRLLPGLGKSIQAWAERRLLRHPGQATGPAETHPRANTGRGLLRPALHAMRSVDLGHCPVATKTGCQQPSELGEAAPAPWAGSGGSPEPILWL